MTINGTICYKAQVTGSGSIEISREMAHVTGGEACCFLASIVRRIAKDFNYTEDEVWDKARDISEQYVDLNAEVL